MSAPVLFFCLWVMLGAVTAMLPISRQYVTGLPLLIAAPVLILWLGAEHGWWLSALGFAAFASMFRNPIRYFYARARGRPPYFPPEVLDKMSPEMVRRYHEQREKAS